MHVAEAAEAAPGDQQPLAVFGQVADDLVGIEATPAEQVRAIENELRKYDPAMLEKPRWLVLNKADLMFEDEAKAAAEVIVAELGWTQPWYLVSAIGREGTRPIMLAVQAFFDRMREDELEAAKDAAHASGDV